MNDVMSINDLGRAIETKYALDQEVEFKINAHTRRLVAEWAAERIGLDPDSSHRFVVELDEWCLKPGNPGIKVRLLKDFADNQIEISENALDRLIMLKNQQARKKLLSE